MTDTNELLPVQDATCFFREALSEMLLKEGVSVGALTELYLVNLLAQRVNPEHHSDRMLSIEFTSALAHPDQYERLRRFREVGDAALLLAGLFWEQAFRRMDRPCHLPVYVRIGRNAYAHMGAEPFEELSCQFEGVADSLVRFSSEYLSTADDVQRLVHWCSYWHETGSRHAARMLAERGIFITARSAQMPLS